VQIAGSFAFRAAHARARVLAPIPTAGLNDEELEPLMQAVRATIAQHFKEQG